MYLIAPFLLPTYSQHQARKAAQEEGQKQMNQENQKKD